MILKPADTSEQDFLVINYPNTGFFIHRHHFAAIIFLEKTIRYKSRFKYVSSLIHYNEEVLPVIDFDAILKDAFSCTGGDGAQVALISELDSFTRAGRFMLDKLFLNDNKRLSQQFIAFKVNHHTQIDRIPPSQIKLIPRSLRSKHFKEGILGCRFVSESHIQFFLDIEKIFMNCIMGRSLKS